MSHGTPEILIVAPKSAHITHIRTAILVGHTSKGLLKHLVALLLTRLLYPVTSLLEIVPGRL